MESLLNYHVWLRDLFHIDPEYHGPNYNPDLDIHSGRGLNREDDGGGHNMHALGSQGRLP